MKHPILIGAAVIGSIGAIWYFKKSSGKGLGPSLTETGANATYITGNYSAMMRGANMYDETNVGGVYQQYDPALSNQWTDVPTPLAWALGANTRIGSSFEWAGQEPKAIPYTSAAVIANSIRQRNAQEAHL